MCKWARKGVGEVRYGLWEGSEGQRKEGLEEWMKAE